MHNRATALVTAVMPNDGGSVTSGLEMDSKPVRVVAVDQHAIVLEAIAARISAHDNMTAIAAETSVARGLRAIAEGKPDVY